MMKIFCQPLYEFPRKQFLNIGEKESTVEFNSVWLLLEIKVLSACIWVSTLWPLPVLKIFGILS